MTLKFFGLMLWISWRRRARSSLDLIFVETDTLSANGISTMYLPAKESSEVSLGPFCGNRLFGNLYQHFLSGFEHVADASVFFDFGKQFHLGDGGEFLFSLLLFQCLLEEFLLGVEIGT